jgi:hypothetical protein
MKRTLILLPGLALLASACQQHGAAYDDAFAKCDAEATEQMEVAQPQPDQRDTWREQYIRDCMTKAGFSGS